MLYGHCFSYCSIKKPDYNSISFFHKQELMSYKGDLKNIIFKSVLRSLYYSKTCNEFVGPVSALYWVLEQQSSFRRNVTAVASRWQLCVRFDRPEIYSQVSPSKDERVRGTYFLYSQFETPCFLCWCKLDIKTGIVQNKELRP